MSEYIKIDATFSERVLFLFTSLINKEFIISTNIDDTISKSISKEHMESNEVISVETIPDKIDIPFFSFDNTNVESNLN